MKRKVLPLICLLLPFAAGLVSCEKWKDPQPQDLGLKSRYCNIPSAINYNREFPGIEDNTTCIFPTDPFVGNYSFEDSIYIDGIEGMLPGGTIRFSIIKKDSSRFELKDYCSSRNLSFTANRFYHATADTLLTKGVQLYCRDLDTLQGSMDYRESDSSLYIEFTIKSDTLTAVHRGRAYKK